ncbi:CocE/NonD family hydrolase [Prosthecobacter sp.]|uniref:CocE/NonD family hydrolase n=1 Tax=Prosthecobacter sp. TaxID=1965333 RepID=UPI00378428A2
MKPLLFFTFMLLASYAALHAEPPNPGQYSAEKFEVKATRGQKAAMRDGVKLSVDVAQPKAEGRFPAILIITPYSNNPGFQKRAAWFAKRGYIVAVADSRGRFDSEGTWDPFDPKHKTDGYDLVEWLASRPWCDGKVGMMGLSYMGWAQWWTATQTPPSLKAIVPEVAPPDAMFNAPYQNGVLVSWMLDWGGANAGRVGQTMGPGPYGGFASEERRLADYMQLPYLKLNELRGALDAPWFEKWIRGNTSSDPYWQGISYQKPEEYAKVTVPSLAATGWFDADFPGAPMNYLAMKKHGATPDARHPRMVIGPWQHIINSSRKLGVFDYGEQAVIDWDGYVCRWFDHWLKGIGNGVMNDAPVHVFVMGRNQWSAEQDWPLPQTRWTKYYLHSGGHANSISGDGVLGTTPPAAGEPASDSYVYDPAKPTRSPFTGGHLENGAADTRKSSTGPDVLVYTTPPLEEEVEVTGPITARLYAATSARDTDWMVRLIDVQPDGFSAMLCEGVMRARHRDPDHNGSFNPAKLSLITPDQVHEYTIEFWRATSNAFLKGHRIRVEISSSFFPYYLRNLNTGADNIGLETTSVVATQKVMHNTGHASHIVLPVIPRR